MCLELESITVKQLFSPVVIKSETNCGLCKSVASEVVKSRERCKICNRDTVKCKIFWSSMSFFDKL
jgi:hypothetical protein